MSVFSPLSLCKATSNSFSLPVFACRHLLQSLGYPILFRMLDFFPLHHSFNLQNGYRERIGLTSHLGDSGMKNTPIICNIHGAFPENEMKYNYILKLPLNSIYAAEKHNEITNQSQYAPRDSISQEECCRKAATYHQL